MFPVEHDEKEPSDDFEARVSCTYFSLETGHISQSFGLFSLFDLRLVRLIGRGGGENIDQARRERCQGCTMRALHALTTL